MFCIHMLIKDLDGIIGAIELIIKLSILIIRGVYIFDKFDLKYSVKVFIFGKINNFDRWECAALSYDGNMYTREYIVFSIVHKRLIFVDVSLKNFRMTLFQLTLISKHKKDFLFFFLGDVFSQNVLYETTVFTSCSVGVRNDIKVRDGTKCSYEKMKIWTIIRPVTSSNFPIQT